MLKDLIMLKIAYYRYNTTNKKFHEVINQAIIKELKEVF